MKIVAKLKKRGDSEDGELRELLYLAAETIEELHGDLEDTHRRMKDIMDDLKIWLKDYGKN